MSEIKVEIWEGRIGIWADLHLNDAIAAIPGSQFERGLWTVPVSWGTCLRLRAVFGNDLLVGPKLAIWSANFWENSVESGMRTRDAITGEGDERLYEFQRPGVTFLQVTMRSMLADEVGSGKTIQYIMADLPKPCLVVAPKSMVFKWQQEFNKWAPHVDARVAVGSAAQRRVAIQNGDVTVIGWQALIKHSRLAPFGGISLSEAEKKPGELNEREWASVVLDEAHNIKNPKAKQTRAAWAVCHASSVKSVVGMTGTPIANQLDDLWSIMHAIDPDEYPSKSKWIERYALKGWNMYGGLDIQGVKPEMQEEFFKILDYRFRRMPKAVTMPFLPPIRGGLGDPEGLDVRLVEMDSKQKKAYDQMKKDMIAELESGTVITTTPLQRALRMLQFASAYATVEDTIVTTDGVDKLIQKVRLEEPSCKVDAAVELLEEFAPEPLIFFAASRQLIDLLSARLTKLKIKHGLVIGGQDAFDRQEQIDMFQAGHLRAILCVVAAGSSGITLTRASTMVVLNRDDSLINNIQMEGRHHRIGSEIHACVRIIDVVAKGTIEPLTVQRLYAKDDHMQEICRDAATLLKVLKESE